MEIPSARWPTPDRQRVRDLIRRMSIENLLWGALKIHGELLKLGIEVAQSTVSIYMVPRQGRPLQTWKSFLRNHVEDPRKDFSQCMQQHKIPSTSSAILPQQERTEPSGHRPCRRGVKSSLRREADVP
jgi:hypothetical protein